MVYVQTIIQKLINSRVIISGKISIPLDLAINPNTFIIYIFLVTVAFGLNQNNISYCYESQIFVPKDFLPLNARVTKSTLLSPTKNLIPILNFTADSDMIYYLLL